MALQLFAALLSLVALSWGAHRLVDGTLHLAAQLRAPAAIIALTAVALGTSAPELMVSISASLRGIGELAVGNALGSNLANIGLVLGISALCTAIPVGPAQRRRELPVMAAVTVLAGWCLWDLELSRADGVLLLVALVAAMSLLVRGQRGADPDAALPAGMRAWRPSADFALGLVLLVASAEVLVWSCAGIALALGISDLVIGLTVVAIGTSLPELMVSVASIRRRAPGIAMGAVLGSNIFNLAAVMAVPAMLSPLLVEAVAFSRDYLAMLGLTAALLAFSYAARRRTSGPALGRWVGLSLLAAYLAYFALLARAALAP